MCNELKKTNNLETIISQFKPPIFWKDKDVVKQQIKAWSYTEAQDLVYEINNIELLIKKHSNNAINILSDFILEKVTQINN